MILANDYQSGPILEWLQREIEAIEDLDQKSSYRCAVYLRDGTYLPCVWMREYNAVVNNRGSTLKERTSDYNSFLGGWLSANSVKFTDIVNVEQSPYAISFALLEEVEPEWAHNDFMPAFFSGEMDDGAIIDFSTTYDKKFFNMPKDYTVKNIKKLTPNEGTGTFRERPYFDCLIENVTFPTYTRTAALPFDGLRTSQGDYSSS
jgi:hypothetical protein